LFAFPQTEDIESGKETAFVFLQDAASPHPFMLKALHALKARWKKWASILASNIPRSYTAGISNSELCRDNSSFVSPKKGSLCIY
jgi:hypothetical protein